MSGPPSALNNIICTLDIHLSTQLSTTSSSTSLRPSSILWKLGVDTIYSFNHTKSSAQALVDAFPDVNFKVVDELAVWPDGGVAPTVVISTVPASATSLAANGTVFLRSSILAAPTGGVVIDMTYKLAKTSLLVLGYHQFELWTGRQCPKTIVERVWKLYSLSA
ncbi:hypothetical protein C8Q74DRAFT_1452887 [Fomes fomentarius]|nr:hypothetical protein C8Q74DRAFT_1452887 [Fomes fomentarius]